MVWCVIWGIKEHPRDNRSTMAAKPWYFAVIIVCHVAWCLHGIVQDNCYFGGFPGNLRYMSKIP